MKILIVDDSRAMRMIVRRTLRQAGIDCGSVVEASTGLEALALASESSPELILCDWNMPEMTGLELLRRLNDRGFTSPFGFVTSESTPEMRDQAAEAGAAFFITKPFTAESFERDLTPVLRHA
jgi:two-component system chemotaxis response regulator CheY